MRYFWTRDWWEVEGIEVRAADALVRSGHVVCFPDDLPDAELIRAGFHPAKRWEAVAFKETQVRDFNCEMSKNIRIDFAKMQEEAARIRAEQKRFQGPLKWGDIVSASEKRPYAVAFDVGFGDPDPVAPAVKPSLPPGATRHKALPAVCLQLPDVGCYMKGINRL